jgi:hypothetical protein
MGKTPVPVDEMAFMPGIPLDGRKADGAFRSGGSGSENAANVSV